MQKRVVEPQADETRTENKPIVICKHCGEAIEPTGGMLYLWTHRDPEQQKCITAQPANGVVERAEPGRGAPDAAHTPGPWRTGREDMQSYDGATGEPFASVYCDDERAGMHLGERLPYLIAKTFGDECKANARLIAQAPTLLAENEKLRAGHVVLLEALRKTLPILIGAIAFVDCKAVVAEVRAAIQQAERGQ